MNDIKTAVKTAAKEVYYVLKNRSFGYVSLPLPRRGATPAYGQVINDDMTINHPRLASATKFSSVEQLLEQYGRHGVYNGTYSSGLDIVRVEETPGVASRKIVPECTSGAKYAISYRFGGPLYGLASYLVEPEPRNGVDAWTTSLASAKLYETLNEVVYASGRRMKVGGSLPHEIVRVIEVPATPTITETVLAVLA